MTPELSETLAMMAAAAADTAEPWWIIGSAAVALQGADAGRVRDVDLMMSAADAERFLWRVGGEVREPGGSERFRSSVLGLWTAPPVPVEVFGGFMLAADGGWREVRLETREAVPVGSARLFVPSREELARLLRAFGRAKDLERAAALER